MVPIETLRSKEKEVKEMTNAKEEAEKEAAWAEAEVEREKEDKNGTVNRLQ